MGKKKQVKLLVVDDHESYCDLIRQSVDMWNERFEIECEFVDTAQQALQCIVDWVPTVIMIDAFISDMNCLEFIDQCCEGAAPLVVTSEYPSTEIGESVISHGACAFISKSHDPDELEMFLGRIAWIAREHEAIN